MKTTERYADLVVKPALQPEVRKLCRKPYHGHKKGCPNWNNKNGCPPKAKLLPEILDLSRPVYCFYNRFSLGEHTSRMKEKHPNWTERQLYCCLYWQGTARKQLREKVEEILNEFPTLVALYCPEACGVNITETILQLGIELEWPPRRFAYQIALVGTPKNQKDVTGQLSFFGRDFA